MRRVLLVFSILLPLMLVGCVSMALPMVSSRGADVPAEPRLLAIPQGVETWEANRSALLEQFQDAIYGAYPADAETEVLERRLIDENAYDGRGIVEEYRLSMAGRETYLVTVRPRTHSGPLPIIVMQLFCGNRAAMGGREDISPSMSGGGCDGDSWVSVPVRMVFGEHIMEPPIPAILDRGYALAFTFAGDIVPDSREAAPAALADLVPDQPSGAIIAWAWVYSRIIDVLERDPIYDPQRMAVWGHSRNGKSALLAAAFDERVDLVIAHQAGTGGTSLNRSPVGESIGQITSSYPHWFSPAYSGFHGREALLPVDQHQLIALMAPRPLLIGGAWRDQWADPQGSFRAARSANPVYALYGSDGLSQPDMASFDPEADIALFMRRGLHGVRQGDWANFLAFLDAHFQPGPNTGPNRGPNTGE